MYRVVVADKDETTGGFFRSLLNGDAATVTSVVSAGELFEYLYANGAPDVLFTEAHLPDADVDSLLAKLQRTCPHTLIVVIAEDSSKETSARIRTQHKPIFYFALKPLSTDEMRCVIDDALSVLDGSVEAAGLADSE